MSELDEDSALDQKTREGIITWFETYKKHRDHGEPAFAIIYETIKHSDLSVVGTVCKGCKECFGFAILPTRLVANYSKSGDIVFSNVAEMLEQIVEKQVGKK